MRGILRAGIGGFVSEWGRQLHRRCAAFASFRPRGALTFPECAARRNSDAIELGRGLAKMRLRMPRVDQVQSEDGSWFLTYEGLDTSHDLGGGNYRFRVRQPDRDISVRARVSASSSKARKIASEEGLDYRSMNLEEMRAYDESIAEKFGKRYEVILFDIEGDVGGEDIARFAKQFCNSIFILKSSYKFNNEDYPDSGDGSYPDEIYFCPYGIEKKYYATFYATEGSDA